ncbi:MAG: maleylpyruvate isomerase family mycothiol-dependent enzyme [Acidimicrobiia bacterium]|nr:maleylpyruvate isomerase family mycothiol-dependent enzyme [Acidimicrobiia bacterium]
MQIAEHIAAVANEGKTLADAAQQAGLEADIDTCPGWDMRDLVRHLSEIHLWAAARVAKRTSKLWPDDISEHAESWPELAVFWPDDSELVDWYLETNANLVQALESASPADDLPTFLPAPSPLAMWARRQAHETAVHRFDAEKAAGIPSRFDPVFAADGIDELLAAFAPRKQEFPIPTTKIMHVHADDTGDHWFMTLGPDGIDTSRDERPADVTVRGAASDLYLLLWNRTEDAAVAVTGERELLDTWHGNHRVRWS